MIRPKIQISVSTDISVLEFYGYIGYIGRYFYMNIDISELNYCDQFIIIGSSQDFKSGHLNISSIYSDISRYILDISRYISDILLKN